MCTDDVKIEDDSKEESSFPFVYAEPEMTDPRICFGE